jgi:hypothetical protein
MSPACRAKAPTRSASDSSPARDCARTSPVAVLQMSAVHLPC